MSTPTAADLAAGWSPTTYGPSVEGAVNATAASSIARQGRSSTATAVAYTSKEYGKL
ncbi:MAG: hypothetical protein WAQ75_05920 [Propionicimonas sp.]